MRRLFVIALLLFVAGDVLAQGIGVGRTANRKYVDTDLPYLGPDYRPYNQATLNTGWDAPLDSGCAANEYRYDRGWGGCTHIDSLSINPVYVDCDRETNGTGTRGDRFNTLAAAHTAISAGDWIIGSGVCEEDFAFSKNLTLASDSLGLTVSGFREITGVTWTQISEGTQHDGEWGTTMPLAGVPASDSNCPTQVKNCRENVRVTTAAGTQTVLKQRKYSQALSAGEFRVDTEDQASLDSIFVRMPDASDPNNATIEWSIGEKLFQATDSGTNCDAASSLTDVHVLGVTFEGSSQEWNKPGVCIGSNAGAWSIRASTVKHSRGTGMKAVGTKTVVREVTADSMGISGLDGVDCDRCLMEYSTARYNSFQQSTQGGHGGGAKWTRSDSTIIRYNTFAYNYFNGFWHDVTGQYILVLNNRAHKNYAAGIFIERGSAGTTNTSQSLVIGNVAHHNTPTLDDMAECPGSCGDVSNTAGIKLVNADSNLVAYNTSIHNWAGCYNLNQDNRGELRYNHFYNNVCLADDVGYAGNRYGFKLIADNGADAATHTYGGNLYDTMDDSTNARFGFWIQNVVAATNSLYNYQQGTGDLTSVLIDTTFATPLFADTTSATPWVLASGSQADDVAVPLPSFLCGMFGPWKPCQIVRGVGGRRDYYASQAGATTEYAEVVDALRTIVLRTAAGNRTLILRTAGGDRTSKARVND